MNKLSPLPAPPGNPTNTFEDIVMPLRMVFWVIELMVWFVSLPIQLVMDVESFLSSL